MKKIALCLMVGVIALFFCTGSSIAQDQTILQDVFQYDSQTFVVAKYSVFGSTWVTSVEIHDALTGLKSSTVVGDDVYINNYVTLDNGKLLLIGTTGYWVQSIIFYLDINYPDGFSKLTLQNFEYVNDYWVTSYGMYFSSTYYPIGDKPSVHFVRLWDFYSEKATKVAKYGEKTQLMFGFADGIVPNPGLMTVTGTKAICYRISGNTGTDLTEVKKTTIPKSASNLWFYIDAQDKATVWYDISHIAP
jgi:hypothetical protein